MTVTPEAPSRLDKQALRQKYLAERDKRLRPEGSKQYVRAEGLFAHYLEDPYVPRVEREPLFDEVTVAFIGGGFSGLIGGARLKQAGVSSVRIIEKGGDFGGAWYWNRYPGAQCDTASFVYMPLLEETGHMPTEKYAHGPEILEHCQRIGKHFGLYDDALFSTEVTGLEWDEAASRWIVRTNRGDEMRAQFVCMGIGPLHRPKLPGIPGIELFQGHSFHTSRWDYDYTGGSPTGDPMTGLADKRVGIIGTGATSVQCIPHLAKAARELYVFQRTPSSIDVRNNEPTDPEWFARMKPGWQEEWLVNFAILQLGGSADQDLVMDGWTEISARIRAKLLEQGASEITPQTILQAFEECDYEKMDEIRARVDGIVQDRETAEGLKPWYRQFCKRPCFHDEYLDAYNEPGTHLVHTDGKGVERITEKGLVAAGREFELDCIIYASGFEVSSVDYTDRAGYDAIGRAGLRLSDKWREGLQTLHGIHIHGFPNLFVITAQQGANLASNYPHNLSESGKTIAAVVAHALEHGVAEVEPTEQAEREWVDLVVGGVRRTAAVSAECTPGYYNNEGQDSGLRGQRNAGAYPDGAIAFFRYIDQWRRSGEFAGLEMRGEVAQ
jgi:cation diffusion facilitator CzcD-associated flavoprotein CzcO